MMLTLTWYCFADHGDEAAVMVGARNNTAFLRFFHHLLSYELKN